MVDRRRVVVIEHVRPVVDGGALPAKAAVAQPLEVSADLVTDGAGLVMGAVRLLASRTAGKAPQAEGAAAAPVWMVEVGSGLDRWAAVVTPAAAGPAAFEVAAMPDAYGTWLRDLRRRHEAGHELDQEFEIGARLLSAQAAGAGGADARRLAALAARLRDARLAAGPRVEAAAAPPAVALAQRTAPWEEATTAGPYPLFVDRPLATFSAWYEMFPRSEGARPPHRSGTLASAAARLPQIAAMGFEIVYFPPLHPIGRTHRKGRNNSTTPEPGDPGSPWAIGDASGGHTTVHPDLGSLEDLRALCTAAGAQGLEVALDLAFHCSPDHPWVSEHPQWFRHLPDGSIRHAENPPKRYQDIYPLDFDTPDRAALEHALLEVVLFWIGHGVRVFRVDNPHTKPLRFWRWLIATVQHAHPDVLFLAEAFTRPRVMERLAKDGFTQSYSYFTWRNTKAELSDYLGTLAHTEMVDWFRPNFWVNTPDILHEYLQRGGPPAFCVRAVLAALTCPSWGMYSGYELCENVPLREGSEEYLDSEKYQYRPRAWDTAPSIAPFITQLNDIRRRHRAAVSQLRTLRLHGVDNEHLLAVSRSDAAGDDVLLVIVNLDPHYPHEGTTSLDLGVLGIAPDASYEARDELTGTTYVWTGAHNYVRLDPRVQPAHVLHLRSGG